MLPSAGIVKYVFNIRQCFINVVDNLSIRYVTVYKNWILYLYQLDTVNATERILDRFDISHMILYKIYLINYLLQCDDFRNHKK